MKKQPLPVPRNNLNKKIEINNLPKSAAAAMLVTSHDINFVMGFIKEDEILTHDNYVRHFFFSIFLILIVMGIIVSGKNCPREELDQGRIVSGKN